MSAQMPPTAGGRRIEPWSVPVKLAVVVVVAGVVLVSTGAALWRPAAGLVVLGAFLVAAGLLADPSRLEADRRAAGGDDR